MKLLSLLSSLLLVVGGINWGLVGIFDFNVVAALFGASVIAKVVYGLMGVSAIHYIIQGKLLADE